MKEQPKGVRIRIAGNTHLPSLLALRARGYRVWLEYMKDDDPSPPGAPAVLNTSPLAAHRSRQALAFAVDPPGARDRLAGNTFIRRAGP
jgi:hypothetical protein